MSKEYEKKIERKERAVVVGRNYGNILTMTRDLGKAGYAVEVFRVYKKKPTPIHPLAKMKPDAYSKYVTSFQSCILDGDETVVIQQLKQSSVPNQKTMLVPVDDFSASIIDAHLDELSSDYFLPSVADKQGGINLLMDKYEQKKLAEEYGLPVLHSVLVRSQGGVFEIPDEIAYPCFIKPNVSMKHTKSMMRRCNNRQELLQLLTRYAEKEDFEVLIEPFADIRNEYSVLGVCTKDGVMAPGVFRALLGGHKERKGVAVSGEMLDEIPFPDIIERCCQFIYALSYTGLFDVDLIETKDGKIYFVELNFRAGASAHALTEMGINLPGMLADYMVRGKPIDYFQRVKGSRKIFVSEKILLEEYVRSDISRREFKKLMNSADIYFIKSEEDAGPYQHFKLFYPIAVMLKIPYRIRDRKFQKGC